MTQEQSNSLVRSLTTCIVGGGSSAHVLIPFLSEAGHHVQLLTRRPNDWHDVVYCEITDGGNEQVTETHAGSIYKKSSDPADVIPDADIIILCMPVHTYRPSLDRLAPYINRSREVFVGTIYGQAGFNWMVHSMEKENNLTNVVCFAIGSIPWICRTQEYGKRVANYGGKMLNLVAVTPLEKFDKLNSIFLQDISERPLGMGKFEQTCSFLSLTLSVDNQIIHPSRCYGLWQRYQGHFASKEDVPYFYKDFDELSAENIHKIDAEYTLIRDAVRKHFPDRPFKYMLDYLSLEKLNHKSGHVDVLSSFKNSKQLAAIKTPTVPGANGSQVLNKDCRFFTDDIPYGLLIAKWFAQKLDVKTPFIDGVICWAQTLRGEGFLNQDCTINKEYCLQEKYTSGIPESYGITKLKDLLD